MGIREDIIVKPEKTEEQKQVDAYIDYVNQQGENFVDFVNVLNECIGIAEKYELIGKVEIKARIKDFDSSKRNTDKKTLDDIFGVEIIPKTERDKEWIMLLTELTFEIGRNKAFDKENGYKAYNQMLSLKNSEDDYNFEQIEEIVKNAKVKTRISNNPDEDIIVDKYPELKKQLLNDEKTLEFDKIERIALFEIMKKLNEFRSKIKFFKTCKYMPIIEMQIKTADVAEKAIRGSARHFNYKKGKRDNITEQKKIEEEKAFQESIKELYKKEGLLRGINVPIKFVREGSKIELQKFEDTLLEMWPFLREDIASDRMNNNNKKLKKYNQQVSRLLCIYPFLDKVTKVKKPDGEAKKEVETNLKLMMLKTNLLGNQNSKETK